MGQAFLEAHRALGKTGTNPNVGCVLVKNNFIIARARTSPGGRPHAEENLISKSKNTSIEDKKLQGNVTNPYVKGKELFKLYKWNYWQQVLSRT